jgi:cyclic-di-GMP phosphodiesterase TipF (flagellum assembly factor)
MLRIGRIFVVLCIVLIAGAVGTVLYLGVGRSAPEAAAAAFGTLAVLLLMNALAGGQRRDCTDVGGQIADLSRGTGDLARQVSELARRTAALEARGEVGFDKLREATAPLAAEVAELGALVRQLAESVAAHDAALATAPATPSSAAAAKPAEISSAAPAAQDEERVVATIRDALDAGRVDLYLQPIVTLPQRKVRYYEALTRLRTEDGRMIEPAEFLGPGEASGLIARLDHMLLFRCVQVLRRLQQKNRDIGLFCNLSAVTLNDPQFFPQMSQFMDANRVLAPTLVIEFKQAAWRQMGPMELESLAALREVGFRFGMDQVGNLRMEPRDIAERGIRFVKAPAALLLGRSQVAGADIHVADLGALLSRFAINLVADHVETETDVVDLLDLDIKFGQGNLFSPPRPVRAEALQGFADTKDPPAVQARSGGAATAMAASPQAAAPN